MAAIQSLRMASATPTLLPRLLTATLTPSLRPSALFAQQLGLPASPWPSLAVAIPAAIQSIPGLLGEIWKGILLAVPKKKTSHMKKRHRQMAGKALKDMTSLNECPGCGQTKKMHTLCPHCLSSVQDQVRNDIHKKRTLEKMAARLRRESAES